MRNLKYDTNDPMYETEGDSQSEQTYGCQGGGREGLGAWIGRCKLANIE